MIYSARSCLWTTPPVTSTSNQSKCSTSISTSTLSPMSTKFDSISKKLRTATTEWRVSFKPNLMRSRQSAKKSSINSKS
jgi:hypothetical protein